MKIAMVSKYLPSVIKSGVTNQVHWLANALCTDGQTHVTLFSISEPPADALYQVKRVPIPLWIKNSRFMNRYFVALYFGKLNFDSFDIIHSHGDNYLLFEKRKMVRTFYGSALAESFYGRNFVRFFSQFILYLLEFVCGFLSRVNVGISNNTKRLLPFIKFVIPVGLDLEKFNPAPHLKTNYPTILFVGTLKGRKRGKKIIEIFQKEVLPSIPSAELWVVHKGPFVKDQGHIKYFIDISQDELIRLYQRAWIFCSASSYEGFGVPYLEAMACGTPVITTQNQGAQELSNQSQCFEISLLEDIGQRISKLLLNQKQRQMYIDQGLDFVKKFDIRKTALQYKKVYEDVLKRGLPKC